MNKGISPVGMSIGFKSVNVKKKPSNIDIAYAKELIAIRNQKQAEDVFERTYPERIVENVKNKIQISIDAMTEKFHK